MIVNIKLVNSIILCIAGTYCLEGELQMCQMPMLINNKESEAQAITVCNTGPTGAKKCASSVDMPKSELLIILC